jgi:TatD DNase family protein
MLLSKLGDRYLKAIPLDRVLTESDGPYAQFKYRQIGPLDIPMTVELLAGRYGISSNAMELQIQHNFERLLSLNGLLNWWQCL